MTSAAPAGPAVALAIAEVDRGRAPGKQRLPHEARN